MDELRKTRKRILDATDELLLSLGYNGFSFRDIAEVVGIRKASIHYHYPTKEELVATYVRKQVLLFRMWAKGLAGQTGGGKLLAYRDLYVQLSGDGNRICPVGVLSAEYPALPISVQRRMDELLNLQLKWISNVLIQGGREGEFRTDLSIPDTAIIIFNTFAGLLKTLRIHHDDKEFNGVCRQLLHLISLSD